MQHLEEGLIADDGPAEATHAAREARPFRSKGRYCDQKRPCHRAFPIAPSMRYVCTGQGNCPGLDDRMKAACEIGSRAILRRTWTRATSGASLYNGFTCCSLLRHGAAAVSRLPGLSHMPEFSMCNCLMTAPHPLGGEVWRGPVQVVGQAPELSKFVGVLQRMSAHGA